MTSYPLVSLTLATLRIAEFGFFGVVVYTRVHTPRFCGHCSKCWDLDLFIFGCLGFRISCCIVGIQVTPYISVSVAQHCCAVKSRTARPQYKKPQSSKVARQARRFFRGSKQTLRSWPLQNEVFRGDPRSISRAYRRIRFRCQQSLNGEYRQDEFLVQNIKLIAKCHV